VGAQGGDSNGVNLGGQASQVPVADWHVRIPDPTLADAILDRLVHNAQRIQLEGESQRKLRSQRSMSHT